MGTVRDLTEEDMWMCGNARDYRKDILLPEGLKGFRSPLFLFSFRFFKGCCEMAILSFLASPKVKRVF